MHAAAYDDDNHDHDYNNRRPGSPASAAAYPNRTGRPQQLRDADGAAGLSTNAANAPSVLSPQQMSKVPGHGSL